MTRWRLATFHGFILTILLFLTLSPAAADQRFIVRTQDGMSGLETVNTACNLIGCTVQYGLDATLDRVFLVTTPDIVGIGRAHV